VAHIRVIKKQIEKMINNLVFIKYFLFTLSLINSIAVWSMDSSYFLPPEITRQILCHCSHNDGHKGKDIFKTVKTVISINSVCKNFQELLDNNVITTLFDQYDNTLKNELIIKIIFCKEQSVIANGISPTFYQSKRRLVSVLLYSGAELKDAGALAYSALKYDDVELIKFLHDEKKINLYQVHGWQKIPIFFYASSIKMVELFEKKGITLDSTSVDDSYPNVLWNAVTCNHIPVEVVGYYFEKNISAEPRSSGWSLLHTLARNGYANKDVDNMLNKVQLLFKKQPASVNFLTKDKNTPLDYALYSLYCNSLLDLNDRTSAEKMVTFLEENGEKKSEELLPQPAKDGDECVLF